MCCSYPTACGRVIRLESVRSVEPSDREFLRDQFVQRFSGHVFGNQAAGQLKDALVDQAFELALDHQRLIRCQVAAQLTEFAPVFSLDVSGETFVRADLTQLCKMQTLN